MARFDRVLSAIVLFFSLVLAASPAQAGAIALSFTDAFGTFRGSFENFGWSFDLSRPETIDGLGLFDFGANGLADEHPVGLWDAGGNLLASATVQSSDPLKGLVPGLGGWRFADIVPVSLAAGSYIIGAFYPDNSVDRIGILAQSILTLPSVTYNFGLTTPGSVQGFATPFSVFDVGDTGYPGFFGPNFSTVPEPSALAILVIGLACLVGLRERRARVN